MRRTVIVWCASSLLWVSVCIGAFVVGRHHGRDESWIACMASNLDRGDNLHPHPGTAAVCPAGTVLIPPAGLLGERSECKTSGLLVTPGSYTFEWTPHSLNTFGDTVLIGDSPFYSRP